MTVHVLPDPGALAAYAAGLIADHLVDGGTNLALAGGSTPTSTYRALAAHTLPWADIPVWLGDERWVHPHDEEANLRMAIDSLGEHVRRSIIPVPWIDQASPQAAAAEYEDLLSARIGDGGGVIRPGLVLLGIGDDAHTASLFPGTDALDVDDRDYVANWVPQKGVWRLTATLPLLHRAERLVFLVSGQGKGPALRSILEGDDTTPAARVAAGAGTVTWLVDEAAASGLEKTALDRP